MGFATKDSAEATKELNDTRFGCGVLYAYLLIGMFLTAWNLLFGILFLVIPFLALSAYFLFFIIRDAIKCIINIYF